MRRQLLIPQGKIPAIIKFKPLTFILPPPKDIVPLRNNHLTSSLRNSRSSPFLPKNNFFSLSKTTSFCSKKGNFFTLPYHFEVHNLKIFMNTPLKKFFEVVWLVSNIFRGVYFEDNLEYTFEKKKFFEAVFLFSKNFLRYRT